MDYIRDDEKHSIYRDKEPDALVLVWKKCPDFDSYKSILDALIEECSKFELSALIVNRVVSVEPFEESSKYLSKIFVPALKKTTCQKIVFVLEEELINGKNDVYPFDVLSAGFKVERYKSTEDAINAVIKSKKVAVSEEILNMTKKQAIEYMGLPSDSNLFAIDDKFWQLSKKYRAMNSPEGEKKLSELSAVYDIATGNRDKTKRAQEIRDNKKKFLGKTSDEWRNHFVYTWYKYLIIIIALVVVGDLVYTIGFKPRYDCGVVTLAHVNYDGTNVEDVLTNELGFSNPYVNVVNVVPSNDQGQVDNGYGDQTASTILMSEPDVVITDSMCYEYYFTEFVDCSALYDDLRVSLPEEVFNKLVPVYYSEREYQEMVYEYEMQMNMYEYEEEDINFDEYDSTPIMIGIMVNDEDFIASLGYTNLWPSTRASLIFSIGVNADDYEVSKRIITTFLMKLS